MEFKFDFNGKTNEADVSYPPCTDVVGSLRTCRKHKYNHVTNSPCDLDDFNKIVQGDDTLYYLKPDIATHKVQSSDLFPLLQLSDLETGEYEGGLKVWECTFDLLDYLHKNNFYIRDEKVLDLGCGSGLLGVYAYLSGAGKVCLQDFNSEVIEHFTIPSVEYTVRNINRDLFDIYQIEFLSGDWTDVSKYFLDNNYAQFDLILSSETIYNVQYYCKLKEILQNHLSDTGVAFFAAKKHYFGVGGGTFDFTEYLRTDGTFDISVVKTVHDYLPREILQVRKIKVY